MRARRSEQIRIPTRARTRSLLALTLGCSAWLVTPAAMAVEVAVPAPPAASPGPAAAPAPPAGQPVAADAPAGTAPASVPLRVGSTGRAVRDLQRALRRRGLRLAVDGEFGPATRRAVKRVQRRLGLRRTGIANAGLLRRLGVKVPSPSAAPPGTGYVTTFPVAGGHSYSDDWGAPRPQGGHEGTDIMAARSTPVVAADGGTIVTMTRIESGLGGIYLWLRRSDGIQYYYAHMQSIADGLGVGAAVTAGQIVGAVGNSGDARNGPTHLHFEVRREWTPFDPYPQLVAVDPDHASGTP